MVKRGEWEEGEGKRVERAKVKRRRNPLAVEGARESGLSNPKENSKHQLEQCSGRCSHIVVKLKFETDASLRPQWETNHPL